MADFNERAAALRQAINETRESMAGMHQDSKAAVQLREHMQALMDLEKQLLGNAGMDACRKCGAKRGEPCAGNWTTCEGSAAHLATHGVLASQGEQR